MIFFEKNLWFLKTLISTFVLVMFIYSVLDKIFPYFCLFSFFFSLFFFYHYLLLNHKTQMDDIMAWYRVRNKLVCDWKWGCHVRGFPLKRELKNFELLICSTEIGQIIRFGGYWWWLKHIKNWGSCYGGKWLKWVIQNSKKIFHST